MKKSVMVIFILILVSLNIYLSSAQVVINEIELNPQGTDGGSNPDWIELYNIGISTVDISGFQVFDILGSGNGSRVTIPNSTQLNAHQFYVINLSNYLNTDEQIVLKNSIGTIIDDTLLLTDNDNDNNTWSRVPDGTENFVFQNRTKGLPNSASQNQSSNSSQQGLNATITGTIVFQVTPQTLQFGLISPGSLNNPALNGPIAFNVDGSTTDVNVEITQVSGSPFQQGLKINNQPALGSSWHFICTIIQGACDFSDQTATPTLDVPASSPAGNTQGTITYTVFGDP